jgi:hypothetical protein
MQNNRPNQALERNDHELSFSRLFSLVVVAHF